MRIRLLKFRVWSLLLLVSAGVLRFGGWPALGLGQDSGADAPYENVQVLIDVPPEQLELIMQAIAVSLGVDCEFCHDTQAWYRDDRPAKQTAREMMRMLEAVNQTYFETLDAPSCWTCHRGSTNPQHEPALESDPLSDPGLGPPSVFVPPGVFSDETRRSDQVYENIQGHRDLPANGIRGVMEAYSLALGVGCEYCHVEGDWASDQMLTKLIARRMSEIEIGMESDFFESREALSCWTCHQGQITPDLSLPPELMPSP